MSYEKRALNVALGAMAEFYNGVIDEKDAEIGKLRAEIVRLTDIEIVQVALPPNDGTRTP